jgi:prepilin-type N-terminal cleavage/methylation domain-containing protein
MDFRAKKNGFTMVEVVLVIILVAILAGVTGNIIMQGADSYRLQYYRRDLMYQAKNALNRMDKEIRMVRGHAATDILTLTANDLEFVSVNGDTIRFSLSGDNIVRTLNGIANILCKDVSGLTFSYLKKDGTAALTAEDVWSIVIGLTVSGNETINFRTRIFPRGVHGEYTGWQEVQM